VYLWKEEIEVVEAVVDQQVDAFRRLRTVLNKDSYRITNRVRIEAFDALEGPLFRSILNHTYSDFQGRMRKLYKEADKLAESLRHNIDVAEEGNSKAILVFTLVTIVFLPLSFVSSVFGMNTVDVRNMDSTQTLFWAIALPVTAAVGGIALLAAYGGPLLHHHMQSLRDLQVGVQSLGARRQPSADEEQLFPVREKQITQTQKGESRKKRRGFALKVREAVRTSEPVNLPPTRSPRKAI
jgi:hypothetical protein